MKSELLVLLLSMKFKIKGKKLVDRIKISNHLKHKHYKNNISNTQKFLARDKILIMEEFCKKKIKESLLLKTFSTAVATPEKISRNTTWTNSKNTYLSEWNLEKSQKKKGINIKKKTNKIKTFKKLTVTIIFLLLKK